MCHVRSDSFRHAGFLILIGLAPLAAARANEPTPSSSSATSSNDAVPPQNGAYEQLWLGRLPDNPVTPTRAAPAMTAAMAMPDVGFTYPSVAPFGPYALAPVWEPVPFPGNPMWGGWVGGSATLPPLPTAMPSFRRGPLMMPPLSHPSLSMPSMFGG